MPENFTVDPKIKMVADAYSLDAVDDALRNMGITLDWSEASVELVESILGRLHTSLLEEKPPRDQVYAVAKEFGSYVGEVFIRHHGGSWGIVTLGGDVFPGLRAAKDGQLFWPWGRALDRLEKGPEHNIWHYYRGLTGG